MIDKFNLKISPINQIVLVFKCPLFWIFIHVKMQPAKSAMKKKSIVVVNQNRWMPKLPMPKFWYRLLYWNWKYWTFLTLAQKLNLWHSRPLQKRPDPSKNFMYYHTNITKNRLLFDLQGHPKNMYVHESATFSFWSVWLADASIVFTFVSEDWGVNYTVGG